MVTVVIPTYNSVKFIEKAINSVLEQTYKDIELIIVDDCSTDNTIDFIEEKYKDISNLRIIKNEIILFQKHVEQNNHSIILLITL